MSKARALTLDQLIAFNAELAALARAGVPLERGLLALRGEEAGALSAFAGELGERMERGESLQQLIAREDSALPPLYRAIVGAGLRGGRLAAALEGLTESLRRVAELRTLMRRATTYPLVLCVVAYLLFLLVLRTIVPEMATTYDTFRVPRTWSLGFLMSLGQSLAYWWFLPPLLLVGGLLWEWKRSRSQFWRAVGHRSLLASMYRNGRLLTFSDLLALLIEHDVPLPEALTLASAASGDASLAQASQRLAADVDQGSTRSPVGFPPLLGFTLVAAGSQADLVTALRRLSAAYERRARRDADWLRLYLPALLTIVIGGGAVLLTTASFLGPWFHALDQLSGVEAIR